MSGCRVENNGYVVCYEINTVVPVSCLSRKIRNFAGMKSLSLYFSPTGGGEKIVRAIQNGMDGNDSDYLCSFNLNKHAVPSSVCTDDESFPVIFTIPVYGGHMPAVTRQRLDAVRSTNGRPAILVAVYGNRAFENALTDLEAFVRERGFSPIAVAAFPSEHSYSTADMPIAAGRPDVSDLKEADRFGRLIREKMLRNDFLPVDASVLKDEPSPEASIRNFVAFVKAYQTQQAAAPRVYIPELHSDQCAGCGACRLVCPTDAIREDFSTDASRCIKCCACVKNCPSDARTFHTPFAGPLSEYFSIRKSPVWVL